MKTKEKTKSDNKISNMEISKIDAIKDILFGENIQNYDKAFDEVKNDIISKKKELIEIISDTKSELDTTIDNLATDLNIRITELENSISSKIDGLNEAKVDKSILGDLFIKLGKQLND